MSGVEYFFISPAGIIFTYILAGAAVLLIYIKYTRATRYLYLEIEQFIEERNIYTQRIKERQVYLENIPVRMQKLNIFRKIIEEISGKEDYSEICSYIVDELKKIFSRSSTVLLYLTGKEGGLVLTGSAKKYPGLVIKEKQGDEFDFWVCRYGQGLLIEDIENDFRFDKDKIASLKSRRIDSLIEAPLFTGQRLQGILRVEAEDRNSFTMEDLRVLSVIADISAVSIDKALILKKMYKMAVHDAMTGLYLRNFFIDRLNEEIKRSLVNGHKFYLLMLDIDDFKKINDTWGHITGDLLLKKIAGILKDSAGDSGNLVSRFGGEEFLALLLEESREKTVEIAEKIRKTVEKSVVKVRRRKISCTVSIGLACFPDDGKFYEDVVRTADRRMYKAKKEGKNKVCFTG